MRTLYADGWIVTCDDAGTEHESGRLLGEDGFVAEIARDHRMQARRFSA
jgi:hypothetical protein